MKTWSKRRERNWTGSMVGDMHTASSEVVEVPLRQIRAQFGETTIRVYQAYSIGIAEPALAAQTFKPPFRRGRMTWIKPSFTWMMYRAGWGAKVGQERILGIDITRAGFEWALAHSCLSHFEPTMHRNADEWQRLMNETPVRIQWDPERTLTLEPLSYRAIQIGLEGLAVDKYVNEWIVRIEDVTPLAREIENLVNQHKLDGANARRPVESSYPLSNELASRIGCGTSRGEK